MDERIQVHYACSDGHLPAFPDDRTIIELCKDPSPENRTLKISESVFVKHGNVRLEECRNQIEARRLLDPQIVRVPQVYRYFSSGRNGFLVMEFIHGVVRDLIEDDDSVAKIARVIKHLQTHQSDTPGPLGGGISRGLFWEHQDVELKTTSRLEEYLNRRMVGKEEGLHITVKELVLNHNDIAPRNIIWMPDGSICLIDWAHAGYYPRLLETVVLFFNTRQGKDFEFTRQLYEKLGPLTPDEEKDVHILHMAWFNSIRYAIKPLDGEIYRLPRSLPTFNPHAEGVDLPVPPSEFMDAKAMSDKLWQDLQRA